MKCSKRVRISAGTASVLLAMIKLITQLIDWLSFIAYQVMLFDLRVMKMKEYSIFTKRPASLSDGLVS